jgi:hypothetical protein
MLATILAILVQIAGATGEASTITSIVNALISLIPTLVQEYEDLVPIVKNIIAALSANPATTADQLATLQTLDAKVDADFEAAATAAQAEDAAPTP